MRHQPTYAEFYAVSSAEFRECRETTREHPLHAKQTCGHLVAFGYERNGSAVRIPRGVEIPDEKDWVVNLVDCHGLEHTVKVRRRRFNSLTA